MYKKLRNFAVDDAKLESLIPASSSPDKDNSRKKKTDLRKNLKLHVNFQALQRTNDDIYAWIYIPDTKVNYPILQHPSDDQYYLNHNIDGGNGYPGCIYSEKYTNKGFSDNATVLYGHNMKNGTMFGSLQNYKNTAYLKQHSHIYIFTPKQTLSYEILLISEYDNCHITQRYDLHKKQGVISFLGSITALGSTTDNSDKKEKIRAAIHANNRFLVLSTCTKTGSSRRLLVIAKETWHKQM
jgi:sortase B